jgi:O-antigen/teichoic acid export membrane protein
LNESLIKRSFSFNVLTLAGGTAFAQAIGLVVVPLLTRLYTPSDYGNYALYTAFFGLLVPLTHFRYALAIMLPKGDPEALEVFRLSLRLSIVFGVTLLAILLCSDFSFYPLPGVTDNLGVLTLIVLAIIFGGMIQSYNEWSNRYKNYLQMSLSRVSQTGGMVITQSIAGFIWGSTLLGLITGHILGNLLGLGVLILGNKNLKGEPLIFSPVAPLLTSLKRYNRFPLYTSWGGILDGVAAYGTPLFFAIYFRPDMVGKYALANTALSAPIMLIGHSISKVLYQKMSEYLKNGLDIKDLVRPVLFRQFLMSLVIAVVIYFFGPVLFGLFFGEKWVAAGHFAQILIPAVFFQFMLSGLTSVLLVKERQDLLLIAQMILALTTVVSIILPGMAGFDENQSLTIFSISRAIANMIYLTIICKVARVI